MMAAMRLPITGTATMPKHPLPPAFPLRTEGSPPGLLTGLLIPYTPYIPDGFLRLSIATA